MPQLLRNVILVLALTMLCGYIGLPILQKIHVGQREREDGPQSHIQKSGTPTFGGLFFLLPFLLMMLLHLWRVQRLDSFVIPLLLIFSFAAIGFWDDYVKVRVRRGGLSVWQKTAGLLLVDAAFTAVWFYGSDVPVLFRLPLLREPLVLSGTAKFVYWILTVIYLFYMSNAVNLSDGLDGLCSSLTGISALMLIPAILIVRHGYDKVASESATDPVLASLTRILPISDNMLNLSVVLLGGCLGFLVFNRHPALVFMGDTGSQALGVGIAMIPLLMGIPWLMLFHGLIFVAEGLSTLLQVLYFKATHGKRLFRMAPLHHHFELGGWSEVRIVFAFCLVQLFAALLGLGLL